MLAVRLVVLASGFSSSERSDSSTVGGLLTPFVDARGMSSSDDDSGSCFAETGALARAVFVNGFSSSEPLSCEDVTYM